MKFIFIADTYNHFYKSICYKFYDLLKDDFKLIITKQMSPEKIKLGFKDDSKGVPFVLRSWEEGDQKITDLCFNADTVMFGSVSFKYIKKRLVADKLTFAFSERLFKKGFKSIFKPVNFINLYEKYIRFRNNKNYYILATGYYAPKDFRRIGIKKNQILNWAYFPSVKYNSKDEIFNKKSLNKAKIVWVGRFVKIKNPIHAIKAAKYLKDNNIDFELNFIGMGSMETKMKETISKYDLDKYVKILGSKPAEEVRNYMEEANIFMFNSNYIEGFGASLYEAMASACCPISSSAVGGAYVLINDSENGYVYKYPNLKELNKKLLNACQNLEKTKQMGIKAFDSLKKEWNGEIGAERLIKFSQAILNKKTINYLSGPIANSFNKRNK